MITCTLMQRTTTCTSTFMIGDEVVDKIMIEFGCEVRCTFWQMLKAWVFRRYMAQDIECFIKGEMEPAIILASRIAWEAKHNLPSYVQSKKETIQ